MDYTLNHYLNWLTGEKRLEIGSPISPSIIPEGEFWVLLHPDVDKVELSLTERSWQVIHSRITWESTGVVGETKGVWAFDVVQTIPVPDVYWEMVLANQFINEL